MAAPAVVRGGIYLISYRIRQPSFSTISASMKRALILDLDNTIYPVSSIADNLFNDLFALIDRRSGNLDPDTINMAKDDLTRKPFQWVADAHHFSRELKAEGIQLLKEMRYELPMQPFDEYRHIKSVPLDKFLVTTGFPKLQWSKINQLGIQDDFIEIHVADPDAGQTKRDIFADILRRHNFTTGEVLVIGDDPESEIKAAVELGIDTFLFDPANKHPANVATFKHRQLKVALDYIR